MNQQQLMSENEIHDFGIDYVLQHMKKDGFLIESVNNELGMNPQIVASKNNELVFVIVRTACYPDKGELASEELFKKVLQHADLFHATCYFAGVGIANAEAKTVEELSLPIKGGNFHILCSELLMMTFSDRVKLLGES